MTTGPGEPWMLQMGRNLVDADSKPLKDGALLLMDRDTKYGEAFRTRLVREGI